MRNRTQYQRAWRKTHPQKVRAYHKKFWSQNRIRGYAATQRWKKRNPERVVWASMLYRCNNPKTTNYKNYGGRGIKVLYSNFNEFLLDVGYRPSVHHTIDRIDNNGNYEVGNCRWATQIQQRANRRDVVNAQ